MGSVGCEGGAWVKAQAGGGRVIVPALLPEVVMAPALPGAGRRAGGSIMWGALWMLLAFTSGVGELDSELTLLIPGGPPVALALT